MCDKVKQVKSLSELALALDHVSKALDNMEPDPEGKGQCSFCQLVDVYEKLADITIAEIDKLEAKVKGK